MQFVRLVRQVARSRPAFSVLMIERHVLRTALRLSTCSLAWLVLVLPIFLAGCEKQDDFEVTGQVTLDGKPLSDALVTFLPTDDVREPGVTRTDERGHLTFADGEQIGLQVGEYRVRISTFDEGDPEAVPPLPATKELVPSKYNYDSKLEVEVKPGANSFQFDLDSKGRMD